MPPNRLTVITQELSGDGPTDSATSRCLLDAVNRGELGETLEVATPGRALAFGKHDTSAAGFASAVSAASDHGYQPTVRIAGGRAAVFHRGTVRFGWLMPVDEPSSSIHDRFEQLASAVVATLGTFGLNAEIGEVPGEYCPGTYSVHVAGRKVMGVGQRLAKNAAYVGGVIVIDGADRINDVLVPVYRHLEIPFDPTVTGSLSDVGTIPTGDLIDRFVHHMAGAKEIVAGTVPAEIRSTARSIRNDHDATQLARVD